MATFRQLRAHDLHLLRHLGTEKLQRVGVHGEQGRETVDVMVRKMAGHDLVHLDQLTRTVGAYLRLTREELFGCPVTCTG